MKVTRLPPAAPQPKSHHIGNPPTSFKNPWPSFSGGHSLSSIFATRFSSDRNFVPVPSTRDELVPVRTPTWGRGQQGLKATWLGHAGFLIETSCPIDDAPDARGIRILFDAVFAERVGPWGVVGPKRFSPTPCKIEELPEIDVFAVSHNHYDHLDVEAVRYLWRRGKGRTKFAFALGQGDWFRGIGMEDEELCEMDWWDGFEVEVGRARVSLTCTPCQHISGRGVRDHGNTLWCSWVLQELGSADVRNGDSNVVKQGNRRRLFFAGKAVMKLSHATTISLAVTMSNSFLGDTAYRTVTEQTINESPEKVPHCPAFSEIGKIFGPFDLALLPIGCFTPRTFMSQVHCSPNDSVDIHKDIRSKKSIGMHWGTIRGGLSAQYEDVREPPRQWKEAAKERGFKWGDELGLCDIGETVLV